MAIDATAQVFQANRPLLAFELFVLRAATRPPIRDAFTINYCLQKLDAIMHNRPLPKDLPEGNFNRPKESQPKGEIKISDISTDDTVAMFGRILTQLQQAAPGLTSHLRHARPVVDLNQKTLHLYFEQSLHYEQVLPHREHKALNEAIFKVYGQNFTLHLELKKTQEAKIKAIKTVSEADEHKQKLEEVALYERASNHPLVKKALEIFGGDITSVKKITPSNPDHRAE
jgi:hypothetical protein